MSLKLINERPLIWAHRGGRSLAAENTLKALRKGHKAGADGWETDVQLTRDGEVIILHDLNLLRSTNAAVHPLFAGNTPALPWRFTLEEIRQLNADIFPRRSYPVKHPAKLWLEVPESTSADARIPTLSEALKLTKELGMWINVEIKDVSQAMPRPLRDEIVKRVLAVIAAEGMDDQVIVSSFNHDYVRQSKELAPHILTGALTPHKFKGDPLKAVQAVNADAWHPGHKFMTRKDVEALRNAGFAVNPYTVNEVADMERYTEWGVTGLVTDRPQDAPRN